MERFGVFWSSWAGQNALHWPLCPSTPSRRPRTRSMGRSLPTVHHLLTYGREARLEQHRLQGDAAYEPCRSGKTASSLQQEPETAAPQVPPGSTGFVAQRGRRYVVLSAQDPFLDPPAIASRVVGSGAPKRKVQRGWLSNSG